ncbi:oligosaccharide flippase family protein [Candidatus Collierbacteria bacterium]|nr:oligosaccharide flippase family protein [Candidatus Collierbacteria bacterium]
MGYKKIAITGFGWMTALRIAGRGVTIAKTAILARILSPVDFGQFGAAALSLSLFEVLTETGVNQALIYSYKKTEELVNSAWTVAIIRGATISILIALSAWPVSIFFSDNNLIKLILLLALVPLIKGFINPMVVVFVKELQFEKEAMFRFSLLIIEGLTAVISAVFLKSAMAFALAMIIAGAAEVILSFIYFKIRPRLSFSRQYLSEIMNYGKWITLSGIAYWFSAELDDFVAGKSFGMKTLGIYQAAYKISTLPVTEIAGSVNQVSFPVMSKLRDEKQKFWKIFMGSIGVIGVIGVIGGLVLWIWPREVVLILLGDKWLGAVPLIRILAVFGLVRSIESGIQPVFLATGRPKVATIGNLIKVVTLIFGLWLLAPLGIEGIAWAALLSGLSVIPYYWWKFREI